MGQPPFVVQAEPVDTFEHLTGELAVSCSALLIYLEHAFDEAGNKFCDPNYVEPQAMTEARDRIKRATEALRRRR